ncbi:MAG TPA: NADH-quinone oxidoreductase subunit N [Syntrophorhabdales bacterium]|nr:NADH-quinone oxidoreductase subunit N [Syntrophorhabdales bacterium]
MTIAATIPLMPILPLIVLSAGSVATILAAAFYRSHRLTFFLTVAAIVVALFSLGAASTYSPARVTSLLLVDAYAVFFSGLILFSALVVTLLSYDYMKDKREDPAEYYMLLLISTIGAVILVASIHFASFFLGLEILSVSLYALIGYDRRTPAIEAGLKYLVLAAASACFLLFGMALVYAQCGTMSFAEITSKISRTAGTDLVSLVATVMILVGVGFKISFVPFHMWTPDVYQGSPAPISAYIATASKGAIFALLLRYFADGQLLPHEALFLILTVIAIISMFVGNLLALFQTNIKRLLAYSSIAHMGYVLVAFLSSGPSRVSAVAFYLVSYFVMTLGAFGVITLLSTKSNDAELIEKYRGLFGRRPGLAIALTAMLLSLAGMPLTAGFIGKFYIVTAATGSALWLLVITLLVNSAISLFYYLRVIATMCVGEAEPGAGFPATMLTGSAVLVALLVVLVWLGVYPTPVLDMIQAIRLGTG